MLGVWFLVFYSHTLKSQHISVFSIKSEVSISPNDNASNEKHKRSLFGRQFLYFIWLDQELHIKNDVNPNSKTDECKAANVIKRTLQLAETCSHTLCETKSLCLISCNLHQNLVAIIDTIDNKKETTCQTWITADLALQFLLGSMSEFYKIHTYAKKKMMTKKSLVFLNSAV